MSKIERTQNASRNIFFGMIVRVYQIVAPFLMRTAMIYLMGIEYLGLNSLFTSILQVLNLAELGVGSAMVFSMYKPIAEGDDKSICALMKLYKTYYRVIGLSIAIVGIALTPFIPNLISGAIPSGLSIYILYMLNLGATVLSYWLFAYKNSLLQAHQRIDIISKISLFTNTIQYFVQFMVLYIFRNYYYYLITMLVTQVLNNVITAWVADRLFPKYKAMGNLPKEKIKEINNSIRDVFTAKIGGVVVGAADTIVISAFLGLSTLAIYQNYYFIISAITSFIMVINNSITAGVGDSLITDSEEKNYNNFEEFNFIIFFILNICICCFSALCQPFMELWVGRELMLPFSMVVLFCVYFVCNIFEKTLSLFKDAAGIWHQDRFRSLIYGLTNLVLNMLFVNYIGLFGILLSTILTCCIISIPWIIINIFHLIYKRSGEAFVKNIIMYSLSIILIACINYEICSFVVGDIAVLTIFIKGFISIIVPSVSWVFLYRKNRLFQRSIIIVKKCLNIKND